LGSRSLVPSTGGFVPGGEYNHVNKGLMSRQKESTDNDFNELLAWLHADAETAASMYETIRGDLIKLFRWRGCSDPEGMADETIIRVTRKVRQMADSYTGSPSLYFYGVAKNLLHEYDRRRDISLSPQAEQYVLPAPLAEEDNSDERLNECFEQCLKRLDAGERKMVVRYYRGQGRAKIQNRKKLAAELGIDLNALRVRTRRVRAKLKERIEKCLAVNGR
jgi:RNA polymerase sigma factor (sigma-70 family)